MKPATLKALAAAVAAIVVMCFLALIFRIISPLAFWIVMIAAALFAYKGLPMLRSRNL